MIGCFVKEHFLTMLYYKPEPRKRLFYIFKMVDLSYFFAILEYLLYAQVYKYNKHSIYSKRNYGVMGTGTYMPANLTCQYSSHQMDR